MKHKHHIIPKYMNGDDSQDNLVDLTIEEHANAHKILYEMYGHWQDKVAWLGLSGIISHEDAVWLASSEGGKRGSHISNIRQGKVRKHKPMKADSKLYGNQHTAKAYKILCPNGSIINIFGLSKWCKENNINMKSFHKQVIQRKKEYNGYKLWA